MDAGRWLLELPGCISPGIPRRGRELPKHGPGPCRRRVAPSSGCAWVGHGDVLGAWNSGWRGASHPRAKGRERRVIFFDILRSFDLHIWKCLPIALIYCKGGEVTQGLVEAGFEFL